MYSLENNVENCLIQFLISSNAFLKRDAGNYIPNWGSFHKKYITNFINVHVSRTPEIIDKKYAFDRITIEFYIQKTANIQPVIIEKVEPQ